MERVTEFFFRGAIPPSKSQLIRALLAQSYAPDLKVIGDSACEDVARFRGAMAALRRGRIVQCGDSGLAFRTMVLRAARIPGEHFITGTERLLSRPHGPLLEILARLGVGVDIDRGWRLRSEGWRRVAGPVDIDRSFSSQFATAVAANAWDLDFPLDLRWRGARVSDGYWAMTVRLLAELGMNNIDETSVGITFPAGQRVRATITQPEPDLSSGFAVAALGAVGGRAEIVDFPQNSTQPDRVFVELLRAMDVPVKQYDTTLVVEQASRLRPLDVNLVSSPDLFPVLAVLCALAPGRSRLYGAPHLVAKESDRRARLTGLLALLGRRTSPLPDGLVIEGSDAPLGGGIFDSDRDHRLIFAGACARQAGAALQLTGIDAVAKSFPEFRAIASLP